MALEDEKQGLDEDAQNEKQDVIETPTEDSDAETVAQRLSTKPESPLLDTGDSIAAEGSPTDILDETCGSEPPLQETPTASAEPPKPRPSGSGVLIRKSYLVVAAIAVVALVVGAVFFGMWLQNDKIDPWEIDPNAKDYESEDGSIGNGSSDSISIPGYADVVLSANTKNVQMVLLNPQGNPCYFRFSLILKDGGEVLYTSGLVPPGQAITDLRLSRALEKGNYDLIISIETFSLNDRSAMNGANVETSLTVR